MSYRALCVSRLQLYAGASLGNRRRTRALREPLPVRNSEETPRLAFGAGFVPDSSETSRAPQLHSRRLASNPTGPPLTEQNENGTTPTRSTRSKQSRGARGTINKNQDYKAAATTTAAGTAAARARLCAEPKAQVSKAIALLTCALGSAHSLARAAAVPAVVVAAAL